MKNIEDIACIIRVGCHCAIKARLHTGGVSTVVVAEHYANALRRLPLFGNHVSGTCPMAKGVMAACNESSYYRGEVGCCLKRSAQGTRSMNLLFCD